MPCAGLRFHHVILRYVNIAVRQKQKLRMADHRRARHLTTHWLMLSSSCTYCWCQLNSFGSKYRYHFDLIRTVLDGVRMFSNSHDYFSLANSEKVSTYTRRTADAWLPAPHWHKLENVAINGVLPLKAARHDAIANLKCIGARDTSDRISIVSFTFTMRRHRIRLPSSFTSFRLATPEFRLLTSVCNAWQRSRMQK